MQTILSPTMQEAAELLINNLLASEVIIRYQLARAHLDQDAQAQTLLNRLSQTQAELRKNQANSRLSKEELDSLRALQAQAQENVVIKSFVQAQQDAVNFLCEINSEINQVLGIDFASFTRHTNCC